VLARTGEARRTDGMTTRLSQHDARRLTLGLQGLADPPRRAMTTESLRDLIHRLGFVQIDSIQTLARAHHMILRARADGYRPALLQRLHERERKLFEHWTHDASFIPVEFYPHWNRRMLRSADRLRERFSRWHGPAFTRHLEAMLDRVRREGPLLARDVAGTEVRSGPREPGWWNWHEGKIALEYLWRSGKLAIAGRRNFQKVYDLAERVVPEPYVSTVTDHDAYVAWACSSALGRLGVATPGEIARFWDLVTVEEAKAWCDAAVADGTVRTVAVEGTDGTRTMLARPDLPEVLAAMPEPPDRIRALSPFDPVLRDRKRLERLFGFDYRIEVFVPAPRRKYGYYVFPLLEGDRLIGRIDMAADRARDALVVTALWPEPGIGLGRGRMDRLQAELDRLRRFAGLARVAMKDGYLREPL
jgi:uncharacterized protein YcaQ